MYTQRNTGGTASAQPAPAGPLGRKCTCHGPKKTNAAGHHPEQTRQVETGVAHRPTESLTGWSLNRTADAPLYGHRFNQINIFSHAVRNPATATLYETDEQTETLDAGIDAGATTADGGNSTSVTCGVTGSWVTIPNGVTLLATLNGNKLGAEFDMIAQFSPTAIPCSCACGEYRQYVRGEFKRNGATVTHRLCGANLDPTTFQEDCARIGGTDYKYGYRSIPFATSKFTAPDQATGCRFEGFDAPGIRGSSGDTLELTLDFRATLIDTCNGATLDGAEWSVAGMATVP
jgi:hypothetical protein